MSIYSYFKIKKINSEKLRSFKKNKTKHTLLHEFPNICTLPDSDVVDFGVPYVLNVLMRRQWHPTPVLLPGKSHWMEDPGGLQSMGSVTVGHD